MKKSIIILITLHLSLFILHSSAQGDWYPLYPIPTGNDLADVCFVDELKGWAVGEKGTILHTSDGGETWGFQESGTELRLRSVIFTDLLTGWIVGGNTHPLPGKYIILKTMDGGINWNIQKTDTNSILNTVHFINSTTGWAAGEHGNLFCTNDGGVNWISQWCGSSWNNNNEVFFLDSLNGWIASESGLYATTNGGIIWELKVECWALSVYFLSPNEGWASTFGMGDGSCYVFHTEDAFNSWDTLRACGNYDSSCGYYSIFFKDSLNGWLLHSFCVWGWYFGCSYDLLKTQDGGNTWEYIDVPSTSSINSLTFSPEGKGCIVGGNGFILTSPNWGNDWIAGSHGNSFGLNTIQFSDQLNGWAAGTRWNDPYFNSGSIMLHTTDGGFQWEEQNTPAIGPIQSVNFIDVNTGWAVGNSSPFDTVFIINTANSGENWNVQLVDTGYILKDIYFIDESKGWVVGWYLNGDLDGKILKTNDGGKTWEEQACDICQMLRAITFVDPEHGWAVGGSNYDVGSIYSTQDGGQTWLEQEINNLSFTLESVCFLDSLEGWVVGYGSSFYGIILHTVDGGANWSYELHFKGFYSVHFKDAEKGLIAASDGTVLFTKDGGITWEEQDSGMNNPLYSIFYSNEGQGYAAGAYGTIVKSDLLTASVDEITFNTQQSTLNIQIFPNPTGGIIDLQFTIYDLQSVSLRIYDLHGREVAVVLDEKLPAGEHSVRFDASGLTAGVYLIRLQAGQEAVTSKLIKIK